MKRTAGSILSLGYKLFLEPIAPDQQQQQYNPHHNHQARSPLSEATSLAIRTLFLISYLPLFCVVILSSANGCLTFVYAYVLPKLVARGASSSSSSSSNPNSIFSAIMVWLQVAENFVAEITLFFILCVLINKVLQAVVEAGVDTISRFSVLSRSKGGKHRLLEMEYALLREHVRYVGARSSRAIVTLLLLGAAAVTCGYFFLGYLDIIESRDPLVIVALGSTSALALAFLAGGAVSAWRRSLREAKEARENLRAGAPFSSFSSCWDRAAGGGTASDTESELSSGSPRPVAPSSPAVSVVQRFLRAAPVVEALEDLTWLHEVGAPTRSSNDRSAGASAGGGGGGAASSAAGSSSVGRALSETTNDMLAQLDQSSTMRSSTSSSSSSNKKQAQQQRGASPAGLSSVSDKKKPSSAAASFSRRPAASLGEMWERFARRFDVDLWWTSAVCHLRFFALALLFGVWTPIVFLIRGPIGASYFAVELLVCLNIPNAIIMLWFKLSFSACRVVDDLGWILKKESGGRSYLPVLILVAMPYLCLFAYVLVVAANVENPSPLVVGAVVFGALAVISRALLLCRFDSLATRTVWSCRRAAASPTSATTTSSKGGHAPWVPLSIRRALVLELAYESGQTATQNDMQANPRTMKMVRFSGRDHHSSTSFLLQRRELHPTAATAAAAGGGRQHQQQQQHNDGDGDGDDNLDVFKTAWRIFLSLFFFRTRGASDLARSVSGYRFAVARSIARLFAALCLLILISLTLLLVAQETFDVLRPLPVTIKCNEKVSIGADGGNKQPREQCVDLLVDHIVVKLRIKLRKQEEQQQKPAAAARLQQEQHTALAAGERSAFCSFAPLPDHPELTSFELALLTLPPYLPDASSRELVAFINHAFGSNWQVDRPSRTRKAGEPWAAWMELVGTTAAAATDTTSPSGTGRRLRLFSVRGTDAFDALDFLEDVRLFAGAFLFHVVSHVLPGLNLVPLPLLQDVIWLAGSRSRDPLVASTYYYPEVLRRGLEKKRLQQRSGKDAAEDETTVLVGHSLGGTLAEIAALSLGDNSGKARPQVVQFSSPGTLFSRKLFNLSADASHSNFFLDFDLFPHLGGSKSSSLRGPSTKLKERAHAVEGLIESMWSTCENVRRRFSRIESIEVF